MLVPVAVMPYLSRVLSTDQYAVYSYTRAYMTFVNLIMDYGFIYSATRKIARTEKDKDEISKILGSVTFAKVMLCIFSMSIIFFSVEKLEQLRGYRQFFIMMMLAACLNNFLPDYLFRGIEKMHILSFRIFIARLITTVALFLFVRSEKDFLAIAYLEILCSALTLFLLLFPVLRGGYCFTFKNLFPNTFRLFKDGFSYFLVTVAPSAYGALNTVFIGNRLSAEKVIYWSTSWNVISAILNMYNPIVNAIYPHMIKKRDFRLLMRVMAIFMPVVCLGTIFIAISSKYIFAVLAGYKYIEGSISLVCLCPVLIFAFPSMLMGSPVLGSIGKERELRTATVATAVIHVLLLLILTAIDRFDLICVCTLRCITEFLGMIWRGYFVVKNLKKKLFEN